MPFTGPELFEIWFEEVWNKADPAAIDKYAAADWVGHGLSLPGRPDQPRRERFKLVHAAFRSAFPDISFTMERTVSEGDLVAAHLTVRGTHTGDGLDIPATGRPVEFSGTVIARVRNDQLVETWESWNLLEMYEQLGWSPAGQPTR